VGRPSPVPLQDKIATLRAFDDDACNRDVRNRSEVMASRLQLVATRPVMTTNTQLIFATIPSDQLDGINGGTNYANTSQSVTLGVLNADQTSAAIAARAPAVGQLGKPVPRSF
jgi:hypothetical protein